MGPLVPRVPWHLSGLRLRRVRGAGLENPRRVSPRSAPPPPPVV
jgi:hypothetical protein